MMKGIATVAMAAVVAVVALGSGGPDGIEAVYAYPYINDPECTLFCEAICDPGEHDAWVPEYIAPDAKVGGGSHSIQNNCWAGSCAEKHPACAETFASTDMDALRDHLKAGRLESAERLIATNAKYVSINLQRAAVQVKGCTGNVVAHFPVATKVAERLAEGASRKVAQAGNN